MNTNSRNILNGVFGCVLLASLFMTSTSSQADGFSWAQPYPGSMVKTLQTPTQGKYRFVTEVDEGGGIGGTEIRGRISRSVYQHPPGITLEDIYAYYEDAFRTAGMQVFFECAGRACGPALAARKWLHVAGISVKTGEHCHYIAGLITDDKNEIRIALMVGEQASQLDIIEIPVP